MKMHYVRYYTKLITCTTFYIFRMTCRSINNAPIDLCARFTFGCALLWVDSGPYEECCARSRYQGQGQVITPNSICGMWLFVPTLGTWFWHKTPDIVAVSISFRLIFMMTSSNGNLFRVTGPLCEEFTGDRWIPRTKASDAELWCFLWSAPWTNGWINNREAGDLRRRSAHYDVIVMYCYWDNHSTTVVGRTDVHSKNGNKWTNLNTFSSSCLNTTTPLNTFNTSVSNVLKCLNQW